MVYHFIVAMVSNIIGGWTHSNSVDGLVLFWAMDSRKKCGWSYNLRGDGLTFKVRMDSNLFGGWSRNNCVDGLKNFWPMVVN